VGRLSSGVGVDMMARRRSIDTPGPWVIASASFVCAAISVFVGWGLFANTLAGIIAFSCFYGALAGGWTSLWTGFIRRVLALMLRLPTG
jgi:MCP family monocarboxylic acid transporter-like MFS transporter 10